MVNLFKRVPDDQGSLTAALLALLEHSDRELLNGFLRRAGAPCQVEADAGVQFQFPAQVGPATGGMISAPHCRLAVMAQAPGEPWSPPPVAPDTIVITHDARPPLGAHAMTWEDLDRWLGSLEERYDAQHRTGFLLRQFREYLKEAGLEYFPGFHEADLAAAPLALSELNEFYTLAGTFFERLAPALSATFPGAAEVRQSRAEDLLAGYCYRDYGGAPFTPAGFLRAAFHLPESQWQVALWLAPGDGAHGRLRTALLESPPFLAGLRALEGEPLLWLWSQNDERKLPLDDEAAEAIASAEWTQYQVGVQLSSPFAQLAGEGSVRKVTQRCEALMGALAPVLATTVH